jgi:hypothetical protein
MCNRKSTASSIDTKAVSFTNPVYEEGNGECEGEVSHDGRVGDAFDYQNVGDGVPKSNSRYPCLL